MDDNLKHLEDELNLIKINDSDNNLNKTEEYIHSSINYMNSKKLEIKERISKNKKELVIDKFLNILYRMIDYYIDINFYKKICEELLKELEICKEFINYQYKLVDLLSVNNYKDIYKLSKLVDMYFILSSNFIEEKIEKIYYISKNIQCISSEDNLYDDIDLFKNFFEAKINDIYIKAK